jgi:hypothetical protein
VVLVDGPCVGWRQIHSFVSNLGFGCSGGRRLGNPRSVRVRERVGNPRSDASGGSGREQETRGWW